MQIRNIKGAEQAINEKEDLVHDLSSKKEKSALLPLKKAFAFFALAILLGLASGYLYWRFSPGAGPSHKTTSTPKQEKAKKIVGIVDKDTFKDSATGKLKNGGLDGEGSFHLERPGGKSQNVYLTSSTVDLSKFVGKKVRVWGETFAGEKAGWLMDVGLVEVL